MVTINLMLEEETKRGMEEVCAKLGITMSEAFALFDKKVAAEKRIPFDCFEAPENIHYLEGIHKDVQEGKAHFEERALLDD